MKKLLAFLLVAILCLGIFTACGKDDEGLAKAAEYVDTLYKSKPELTTGDFDVVGKVVIDGTTYTVTWTSSSDKVTIVESDKAGIYTVKVPVEPADDVAYTLTATIANEDGDTLTKTYNRKVPKYEVMSYDDYIAAKAGDPVVVVGVVTARTSKAAGSKYNHLYIQDADGGYYAYSMAKDPVADLGIEVGMTVEISGIKDIYSGTHEIKDATAKIKSTAITPVTPVDITDIFKAAETKADATLTVLESTLVTIKGVEITGQETEVETSQYYKFKLDGIETYIRVYNSDCPVLDADDKAAIIATHTGAFGKQADVTGIVMRYNGEIYLNPVDVNAFTNITEIQRTPAEKVALELGNITVTDKVTENTTITLPLAGTAYPTEVKIAWAVDNAAYTITEDGKLVIELGVLS